jgi:phthalate 4,5-cis-dihydrodiol dehydrogenase
MGDHRDREEGVVADELGVLILGAGRVSGNHAAAITATPGARLAGIFDIDEARVEAFEAKHGCPGWTALDRALAEADAQVVMIGLPNHLHAPTTIAACAAGKHVFVEKPMANTVEECDAMIAAAEAAGVRVLVAHSQRYFASTIRARELVQGGALGRPVFATDTWYKPFGIEARLPWFLDRATGGGMWLMNGAHMIDRTCWVLDTEVDTVKAWITTKFHDIKADDTNMALLQLKNGSYATIVHAGYKGRGVQKCEVEITCTDGMLLFDSYSNRLAVDKGGKYEPETLTPLSPFAEELKNLVGAINGTEELRITPQWGRHIMAVLEACEESSRTGKEVRVR